MNPVSSGFFRPECAWIRHIVQMLSTSTVLRPSTDLYDPGTSFSSRYATMFWRLHRKSRKYRKAEGADAVFDQHLPYLHSLPQLRSVIHPAFLIHIMLILSHADGLWLDLLVHQSAADLAASCNGCRTSLPHIKLRKFFVASLPFAGWIHGCSSLIDDHILHFLRNLF